METVDGGALAVVLTSWPTTRAAKPNVVNRAKKRMLPQSVKNIVRVQRLYIKRYDLGQTKRDRAMNQVRAKSGVVDRNEWTARRNANVKQTRCKRLRSKDERVGDQARQKEMATYIWSLVRRPTPALFLPLASAVVQ